MANPEVQLSAIRALVITSPNLKTVTIQSGSMDDNIDLVSFEEDADLNSWVQDRRYMHRQLRHRQAAVGTRNYS